MIETKLNGFQKVSYDIKKNQFNLELGDCQVLDNQFYVKTRIYVLLNKDTTPYTSIIKKLCIFVPCRYADRLSTNHCPSP